MPYSCAYKKRNPLVPKLQLGNAPVPEALLHFSEGFIFNAKQSFSCNHVPKLELGNEANEANKPNEANEAWLNTYGMNPHATICRMINITRTRCKSHKKRLRGKILLIPLSCQK